MAIVSTELQSALRPLVGAKIRGAHLLIWPNADGVSFADTQLNLSVETSEGSLYELTIRTGPDGQTPFVERESITRALPAKMIEPREALWREPGFLDSGTRAIEAFDIGDNLKTEVIAAVGLICFADSLAPAGIKITLSSGREIWSVTADDGNRIFSTLPDQWFDDPMTLVSVV
jgi:hypothetical protein